VTGCRRQGFGRTIRSLDCEAHQLTRHLVFSSIGSSIISYSKGIPLADYASTSAPSSPLLLLIRRPVTIPVLRSGGKYHFFRTHTYSNLSVRPYLHGAICYYDNLYEGYGPFMTVRTTLNKHITSQDLGYLEVKGGSEV